MQAVYSVIFDFKEIVNDCIERLDLGKHWLTQGSTKKREAEYVMESAQKTKLKEASKRDQFLDHHFLKNDDDWETGLEKSFENLVLDASKSCIESSKERIQAYERILQERQNRHRAYETELIKEGWLVKEKKLPRFRYLIPSEPLNESENQILQDLNSGPAGEEICERYSAPITKQSLRTLNFGCWLNDEIINCYMQMLENRVSLEEYPDRPYMFSSFFLTKLIGSGQYKYSEVQRWTARGAGKADLFSRRAILFPVNCNNVHWCLACADVKFRKIYYLDSMSGAGTSTLKHLLNYLKDEMKSKKNENLDENTWELISPTGEIPQQDNTNDCGVFTCTFANILTAYYVKEPNQPISLDILDFSSKDMRRIRQQIQLDIVQNRVFPSVS